MITKTRINIDNQLFVCTGNRDMELGDLPTPLQFISCVEHEHTYMNEGREVSSLFPKKRKEPPTSAEDSSAFHDHPYVSMNSSSIQKQNLKNAEGTDDEEEEEEDSDVDGEGDDDRSSEAGKNGANFHELQGRHIIEINFLAKELMKGCHYCCKPLNLSACIGDSRYGLGSLLHIKCENCKKVSLVPTGKRHGPNAWDVNSKLGAAMLFCGIGETAINALLAALNLPSVTPTTLKRREREAGVAFEAVADATCQNAILNEKNSCEVTDSEEAVSFDAGWQTRGSGRNYASLSGHGSMIGVNTGKVLAYSFRSKKCRFCDRAKEGDVKEHDCRKNWDKSSKAMESDMAIEMLQDMKNKGFHVKKLIMDNDSTTISRAKITFDEDLEKQSDFNHTKKNFTNKLFELRKEKKYAALGPKTIKHLTKCFAYAVKSATDKASLTTNLSAIPLHVFGNHSQCGDWCGLAALKQMGALITW
ncbi:uncharacterized protein LOC125656832 isoform X3 [Ostrea edulis]|uniref:uncharacterized protein LOC125656832 isoform X3 n=1 Tax=Ostrea edulis TaxID=37623 RepID=UPI002094BA53|nr:uncharacterized protein LOC125656832 isoform X3 [Ostrea edulis]